ncbi:MAG: hypothetical protein LBI43_04565 [Streptococcaceae bacterium]|nr:hypothetical protein [Streptococcaceae bacterium]
MILLLLALLTVAVQVANFFTINNLVIAIVVMHLTFILVGRHARLTHKAGMPVWRLPFLVICLCSAINIVFVFNLLFHWF